jgi:hypothetical protein
VLRFDTQIAIFTSTSPTDLGLNTGINLSILSTDAVKFSTLRSPLKVTNIIKFSDNNDVSGILFYTAILTALALRTIRLIALNLHELISVISNGCYY